MRLDRLFLLIWAAMLFVTATVCWHAIFMAIGPYPEVEDHDVALKLFGWSVSSLYGLGSAAICLSAPRWVRAIGAWFTERH